MPSSGAVSYQGVHQQKLTATWGEALWSKPVGKSHHGVTQPPSGAAMATARLPLALLPFGPRPSRDSQLTFKISLNSWLIYFVSQAGNLWKYILKNQTKCTLLIDGPFSDISQSK